MSSIPAEYQPLGVIERDHGVQLIGVVKAQVHIESLLCVQVESVVNSRRRRRYVFDQIQKTADDDAVAVLAMAHRYIPRFLNSQGVGVKLGDEEKVGLVLSGVDCPKTVLIHGQVKEVVFR